MLLAVSLLPLSTAAAIRVNNTFAEGVYTGVGIGHEEGEVTVSLTIGEDADGNKVITDITADGSSQTPGFWKRVEGLVARIKENNGTDGVDVITGATQSSSALLSAVEEALTKAQYTFFASGAGTSANPFVIETAEQLAAFAEAVDAGSTFRGKTVALGADIDLAGIESWNPIGAETGSKAGANPSLTSYEETDPVFNGVFDGQGHAVKNMTIKGTFDNTVNLGLFSALNTSARVRNLKIENAVIDASASEKYQLRAGILAGDTVGGKNETGAVAAVISDVTVSGSVHAATNEALVWAGGLVGRANISAAILNCAADVEAYAYTPSTYSAYAGGIVGSTGNNVSVINCASFGSAAAVAAKSTNFGGMAGGIAAMFAGKMYNVYSAMESLTVGNAGISDHQWIGGVAGEVTTSGMVKDAQGVYGYPAAGDLRKFACYPAGEKQVLETYNADTLERISADEIAPQGVGVSATVASVDKVFAPEAVEEMNTQAFADRLNANLAEVRKLMKAYGIDFLDVREWKLANGRVLPAGDVWEIAEVDAAIFAGGTGAEADPYVIEDAAQLFAFADSMNSRIDYTGKYVALGADIDVSGETWKPVGGSSFAFNGTFDGRSHTVSGMTLGRATEPFALDSENVYVGFFGVLGADAKVKNLRLTEIAFYTHYDRSAYVGGLAGVTDSKNAVNNEGFVIDNCSAQGVITHYSDKGNNFVGGLLGMQVRGALINSHAAVDVSCTVSTGYLAEVGGLVGLNNRGLVANCYTTGSAFASGCRDNGEEGMGVVSSLVGVQAGALVNCYGMGNNASGEYSVYVGAVSGWITGIGKTYNCLYNLNAAMTIGTQSVKPVEAIGTQVPSGVNDEGDKYVGGLSDRLTGFEKTEGIEKTLNESFAAFPIDITLYGVPENALRTWKYDADQKLAVLDDVRETAVYVMPDVENVPPREVVMQAGVWYGRNEETVVEILVDDNTVTEIIVLSGSASGEEYDKALAVAVEKAQYGDASHYFAADPARFAGGNGTKEAPYEIADEAQLRYLAQSVNADTDWKDAYFILTADIDLKDGDWFPIGAAYYAEINGTQTLYAAYPFCGHFDGRGHTVSGLTIGSKETPASLNAAGLFGFVSGGFGSNEKLTPEQEARCAEIVNVALKNVDIHIATRYQTYVGGLVGNIQNGFFIDNCSVTGRVSVLTEDSFARAGGISGSLLRGSVTNTWADVAVDGRTLYSNVYAGGAFAMTNRATVVNCYALGSVTGESGNTNKTHLGGFAGLQGGVDLNCYAMGDVVSLTPTSDVGGLNGRLAGIAIDDHCYFNADAKQANGSSVNEEAVASGVVAGARITDATAKTAKEMAGEAFAALLTENAAGAKAFLAGEIDEALASLDLVHINYYRGNELYPWTVLDDHAGFAAPAPAFSLGDVDADGNITTSDARLALRIAIGLEPALTPGTGNYKAADINLDGEVKTGDARLILRRAIGIIDADQWGIKR